MRAKTASIVVVAAATCVGCGGGGGAEPRAPVQVNREPVVVGSIPDQQGLAGHPFALDLNVGGPVFADPDGDPLVYQVNVVQVSSGSTFGVSGATITGILGPAGSIRVRVLATDGLGGGPALVFTLSILPNSAPVVARPNSWLLVAAGQQLNYDPTQGGSAFTDPDGDRVRYSLRMASPSRGLSIDGTRVIGALGDVGLVTFELIADDGYGGEATDRFSIAVAAPEPGEPILPAVPYVYANEELPLPHLFARSDGLRAGVFWDMTPLDNRLTNAGATLGRVLFYDKRLSLTNTHACASCHHQATGFASPERFNTGAQGVPLKRNSMALANVRYNLRELWFSDQRVASLEALVLMPIQEPTELASFLPLVETKLAATDFYPALFEAAFGTPEITRERIAKALAQFLRSLITYRAAFDRAYSAMDGLPLPDPASVLTPEELRGAELFRDFTGTRCGRCHSDDIQALGGAENNGLDAAVTDPGFQNQGRFRASSLRNIAVTAPYMHDGRFATLREVIDHYDHGVMANPHLAERLRVVWNDPTPRRLNLSEADKQALEAFLRTLTDYAFLTDPRFGDPF